MKIFIVLLVATFFYLMLKVIRLGLKRLVNRYTGLNFINNILVVAEVIIWLAYIFWAVYFLFRNKFYYPYLVYAMIFIVAGFMAWFLIKDIFAGIIFRIKHNLKTGSYIHTGDISGQIKAQQITYLKIMTDDGQLIRVPYSKIVLEVITELAYRGSREQHIINIQVDLSLDKTKAESLIRAALLNTPWSNLKEDPAIKFLKEKENGYLFEITLLSKNLKQIKSIEMALDEIPLLHVVS
jgi:small-conductance mechanosensitive channel